MQEQTLIHNTSEHPGSGHWDGEITQVPGCSPEYRLDWTDNTTAFYQKGLSRLHPLRRLRSFVLGPLLRTFDDPVVASALLFGVVCWGSSISPADPPVILLDVSKLQEILRKDAQKYVKHLWQNYSWAELDALLSHRFWADGWSKDGFYWKYAVCSGTEGRWEQLYYTDTINWICEK